MYLPKSKYVVVQAKPGEFMLDGQSYVGPVVRTFTGDSYAGDSIENLGRRLENIKGDDKGDDINTQQKSFAKIKRVPTEKEYAQKYMIRYFKQHRVTLKTVEILPEEWDDTGSRNTQYNYTAIPWNLVGTLHTRNLVNGVGKVVGIVDKNRECMEKLEKLMPGVISSGVLDNPAEFTREK